MPGVRIGLDEALDLTRTGDVWLFRGHTAADRAIDSLTGPSQKGFRGADNMPLEGKASWTSDMTGGGIKGPVPKPSLGPVIRPGGANGN